MHVISNQLPRPVEYIIQVPMFETASAVHRRFMEHGVPLIVFAFKLGISNGCRIRSDAHQLNFTWRFVT